MKTEKKTQVVMLRTRTNSVLSKAYLANPSYLRFQESSFKDDSYSSNDNQHLYFLSDDEIKEGDWYLWFNNNQICQANGMLMTINKHLRAGHIKKIITSTDKLSDGTGLGIRLLPRPSNSFIQKYVEEYNKGNIITEVMVECESGTYDDWIKTAEPVKDKLKTKPDNTIIISAVEETWDDVYSKYDSFRFNHPQISFIEWLKQNNYQVIKS